MSRIRRVAAGLCAALLAALGGCSDDGSASRSEALHPASFASAPQQEGTKLAYSHDLTITLRPEAVATHFAATRDRCLKEAAPRCILLQSSIRAGAGPLARPEARIELRLPHDAVAAYVAFLIAPLPGESAGDVTLREQTTRAEDLSRPVADTAKRLAQLTDYRDRLANLAQKSDLRVEDLVKIAAEQSQVQAQIEDLEGKRRGLDERLETEGLTILFRTDEARTDRLGPVAEAWARGGRTLGDSTGSALRFAIASLPWLPIVAIGLLLVRTVWRLRRRPERKPPGSTT